MHKIPPHFHRCAQLLIAATIVAAAVFVSSVTALASDCDDPKTTWQYYIGSPSQGGLQPFQAIVQFSNNYAWMDLYDNNGVQIYGPVPTFYFDWGDGKVDQLAFVECVTQFPDGTTGPHYRYWGPQELSHVYLVPGFYVATLVSRRPNDPDVVLGSINFGVSAPPKYGLEVIREGSSGRVTSQPSGIDCGLDCWELFELGQVVTLTAMPDADSVFGGWSALWPDCKGTDPICVLRMDKGHTAAAQFALTNACSMIAETLDDVEPLTYSFRPLPALDAPTYRFNYSYDIALRYKLCPDEAVLKVGTSPTPGGGAAPLITIKAKDGPYSLSLDSNGKLSSSTTLITGMSTFQTNSLPLLPEPWYEVNYSTQQQMAEIPFKVTVSGKHKMRLTLKVDRIGEGAAAVILIYSGGVVIESLVGGSAVAIPGLASQVMSGYAVFVQQLAAEYPQVLHSPRQTRNFASPLPAISRVAPSDEVIADLREIFGATLESTELLDTLDVTPTVALAGQPIRFRGAGFTPGGQVYVMLAQPGNPTLGPATDSKADAYGVVAGSIGVPASGRWIIAALDVERARQSLRELVSGSEQSLGGIHIAANGVEALEQLFLPSVIH